MEDLLKKFQNREILVTGGCGFIGSTLSHQLVKANAKVTIFDNLNPDVHNNFVYHNSSNIEDIQNQIKIIKGDIRDFEAITDAIKDKEIIFHCAAHTSHPESVRNPHLNLDINCNGSLNLLEAARRSNDKATIVNIGTSTQIGKKIHEKIDENHPEFPRDVYSANKTAVEKYHLIYHQIYGLPTVTIRAANNYGPRAAIHSPNFGFINYFIGLALKNKEITIYEPGNQTRSINYVEDTAEAVLKASLTKKSVGHTIFATTTKNHTIKEISQKVISVIGGSIKMIPWPAERKAMEVGDVLIDNKKSKEMLNWEPKVELTEGLEKTKQFYQPRLNKYLS